MACTCPEDWQGMDRTAWCKARERHAATMNKWERGIREKVYAANILSPGEWVYLVGCLNAAHDESSATHHES